MPPTRDPLRPGSLVASRYEILALLGAGGMGRVFEARDRLIDETVALKIVAPAADDALVQRFRSEVKLAWRVRHRNVCGIHGYGEDAGLLFISMERVEGRNLKQLVRERGALIWEDAYDVALQIAEGLGAIHEAGVIHRDLKPANVMLDDRGVVRLMDFGIAKAWGSAGLTGAGQVVGSPEYMCPEQVRGLALDFRSDLYSLGLVLFEIFAGRALFAGRTPGEVMRRRLQADPSLEGPEAAQIPSALLPVLRRALRREPSERYPSCQEMATALQHARDALAAQLTDALPVAQACEPTAEAPTVILRRPGPESASAPARFLVAPLQQALKHPKHELRAGAAQALGRIGREARGAIPSLVEALRDSAWQVRREAACALGELGALAEVARAALLAAQTDGDERVRAAASESLARLSDAPCRDVGAAPGGAP